MTHKHVAADGSALYLKCFSEPALLRRSLGAADAILLEPSKLLAVIVYLASAPGRTTTRDNLIDLLWSHLDPEQGRHAVRQHLWELKRQLGAEIVIEGRDRLVLRTSINSDRSEFITASEESEFEHAVRLYTGDFFPGFAASGASEFERWADKERTELRARYLSCAEIVIRDHLNSHHSREAVELARRVRDTDPLRQHSWRLVLESLIAANDFISASVESDALLRMVEEEAAELDPATRSLIATVRRTAQSAGIASASESPLIQAELVGREREFSILMQDWDHASSGRPSQVCLNARAGLGKTRLLEEFKARLQSLRVRHVLIRANAGTSTVPFAVAGELAEKLGSLPGARGVSPSAMQILVTLNPSLSSVFPAAPIRSAPQDDARHRLLALKELVVAVASERPLAILIDDLHWCDPASRILLSGLATSLEEVPVLVCTTTRDTAAMAAVRHLRVLSLEPLSRNAISSLVSSVASLPDEPWAARMIEYLARHTRGVPLYAIESLQLAIQEGVLTTRAGSWYCEVPDQLETLFASGGVLHRRLGAMDPGERKVLQVLAVAAAPISDRSLQAAVASDGVTAALLGLQHKGLVVELSGRYTIAHDEIASLALQSISPTDRAAIERQVGISLSTEPGGDSNTRRHAATLLAGAGALAELGSLARSYFQEARRRGDPRSVRTLTEELLGDSAPEAAHRAALRSVSPVERILSSRIGRAIAPAGILFGLLGISMGAYLARRPEADRADAMLQVPLRIAGTGTRIIAVPIRRGEWDTSVPIRVSAGKSVLVSKKEDLRRLVASPNGWNTWVATSDVSDSGGTELFVYSHGGRNSRRLTNSPGDDVEPSWSPDGRFLVFSTARWDSLGHTDLAIVATDGGPPRQLTHGPTSAAAPNWSPDGTRIVFTQHHHDSGRTELCSVRVDGSMHRCLLDWEGVPWSIVGWSSDSSVLTERIGAGQHEVVEVLIREDTLLLGARTPLPASRLKARVTGVSPDGRWMVGSCETGSEAPIRCVLPRDEWVQWRRLQLDDGTTTDNPLFTSTAATYLDRVFATNTGFRAIVGVPFQLDVAGVNKGGLPVVVRGLELRALDGSAEIDSEKRVVALKAGPVPIEINAGGWRRDTVTLLARLPDSGLVVREDWEDGLPKRWAVFGDPEPVVVAGEGSHRALFLNGDGYYHSGVHTRGPLDGSRGLFVRTRISTRVTTHQWQHLRIALHTEVDLRQLERWDHKTGYVWRNRGFHKGCGMFFPPPYEQIEQIDSIEILAGADHGIFAAPPRMSSGDWNDAIIQLFPDGHCAVAVNNQLIGRSSPAMRALDSVYVSILGNSVGTRILVGGFELHRGIAPGIDWFGPLARSRNPGAGSAPRPRSRGH